NIVISWDGNAYGEISTPMIEKDLATSTDWSHSSANFSITKRDTIPPADSDPRTWPIVYAYTGSYDPVGNGLFEFSGEFEINAFGAIKWHRHQVVSRSLWDYPLDPPEHYVVRGPDVAVAVPQIPAEQVDYLRKHVPS